MEDTTIFDKNLQVVFAIIGKLFTSLMEFVVLDYQQPFDKRLLPLISKEDLDCSSIRDLSEIYCSIIEDTFNINEQKAVEAITGAAFILAHVREISLPDDFAQFRLNPESLVHEFDQHKTMYANTLDVLARLQVFCSMLVQNKTFQELKENAPETDISDITDFSEFTM